MNPVEAKRALRAELRARVAAMNPAARADASAVVRGHIAASAAWGRARVVMVYAADGSEPDLDALIGLGRAAGKTVCVPRVDWEGKRLIPGAVDSGADLADDRYGIRVPATGCAIVDPASLDLVVVPGVGFTGDGTRLGRGGGFYDRFLAERSAGGSMRMVVLGACFAAQVVGRIPSAAHDRRVDGLVTEAGLVMVAQDTEVADESA
jgi:5-formyltetrahydrofolate cyclo-ligase